ncbi:radical SAM protein [Clostridium hydrogeniformans]|uniref:radical SAM protein n=1 Tax=Clostridium hydrogeniformans TaxID=349933 RepID=UPI00047F0AEC|nr:radical SAM protein [Clostridium hydrogeniformans]
MSNKLINKFDNYLLDNRIPIRSSIQLTYNCNFKCIHCYQTPIKNQPLLELSTKDWFLIIDKLKEKGCIYITFTGGEVFTRKDFLDIYLYAYNKNFKIHIISNGSLITNDAIDILSKFKPESISITLYGINNKTYNDFTRSHNSFDLVHNSILKLKTNGINLKIQVIANIVNENEINLIRNFAKKNKFNFHLYGKIRCYLDGNSYPKNLQVSPSDLINLYSTEEKLKLKQLLETPHIAWDNGIKKCKAGLTNTYIDPQGSMYLCNLSNKNKFSLLENSFEYCWDKILKERKSEIETKTYCSNCSNKGICGLCAPIFKNEYNNLYIQPKNECNFSAEFTQILLKG